MMMRMDGVEAISCTKGLDGDNTGEHPTNPPPSPPSEILES